MKPPHRITADDWIFQAMSEIESADELQKLCLHFIQQLTADYKEGLIRNFVPPRANKHAFFFRYKTFLANAFPLFIDLHTAYWNLTHYYSGSVSFLYLQSKEKVRCLFISNRPFDQICMEFRITHYPRRLFLSGSGLDFYMPYSISQI